MQPQLFPSTHGQRQKPDVLRCIKDPGSAITHGIGFVLSFIAAIPLISLAIHSGDIRKVIAMSVFSLSMMALYAASTCYHAFHGSEKAQTLRKKIDHMMIFVLIAGSYTPAVIAIMDGWMKIGLLVFQWGMVIIGIFYKIFAKRKNSKLSLAIYLCMGWSVIILLPQLIQRASLPFLLYVAAGGIAYSVGAFIYAKKPFPYAHVVWHLFVAVAGILQGIAFLYYLY